MFGMEVVMGLIPGLTTMFGTLSMYGHDLWLHTLLGVSGGIASYAGAKLSQ